MWQLNLLREKSLLPDGAHALRPLKLQFYLETYNFEWNSKFIDCEGKTEKCFHTDILFKIG